MVSRTPKWAGRLGIPIRTRGRGGWGHIVFIYAPIGRLKIFRIFDEVSVIVYTEGFIFEIMPMSTYIHKRMPHKRNDRSWCRNSTFSDSFSESLCQPLHPINFPNAAFSHSHRVQESHSHTTLLHPASSSVSNG